MANAFTVRDDSECSEAVWRSRAGDKIIVKSGDHGVIPLKRGVGLHFEPPSTITLVVYPVGWQGYSDLRGVKTAPNVMRIFIFTKLLPFDLRLPKWNEDHPYQFLSPEGCTLKFFENVTGRPDGSLSIRGPEYIGDSFAAQRPKALVQIAVPSTQGTDEQEESVRSQTREFSYGQPGMDGRGDALYLAFWTLCRFLRAYGEIAQPDKTTREGLSIVEFVDGVTISAVDPWAEGKSNGRPWTFLESYSNVVLPECQLTDVQDRMLGSADVTLEDHTDIFLERLQYHAATVSMCQSLEMTVDLFLDGQGGYKMDEGFLYRADRKLASSWHKVAEAVPVGKVISLSDEQRGYLCELIDARNNIVHRGRCNVTRSAKTVQQYPGIVEMSEYAIYRAKRPWYWYHRLVLPVTACLSQALEARKGGHT
jgi:hypothetical protein